jgi:hypothetical protein
MFGFLIEHVRFIRNRTQNRTFFIKIEQRIEHDNRNHEILSKTVKCGKILFDFF